MIATASPFTGFQPSLKVRAVSNDRDKSQGQILSLVKFSHFDKALCVPYGCKEPSVANSLLSFSGILQTT